jgi:hypothetical protein
MANGVRGPVQITSPADGTAAAAPIAVTVLVATANANAPPRLLVYQIDNGPTVAITTVAPHNDALGNFDGFQGTFNLTTDDLPQPNTTYTLTVYAWDDARAASTAQINITRN